MAVVKILDCARNYDIIIPAQSHKIPGIESQNRRCLTLFGTCADYGVIDATARNVVLWRSQQQSLVRFRVQRDYRCQLKEIIFQQSQSGLGRQSMRRGKASEHSVCLNQCCSRDNHLGPPSKPTLYFICSGLMMFMP